MTLLAPVMPATTAKVHAALGHTPAPKWSDELRWGASLAGAKVQAGLVLFPRPEKAAGGNVRGKPSA